MVVEMQVCVTAHGTGHMAQVTLFSAALLEYFHSLDHPRCHKSELGYTFSRCPRLTHYRWQPLSSPAPSPGNKQRPSTASAIPPVPAAAPGSSPTVTLTHEVTVTVMPLYYLYTSPWVLLITLVITSCVWIADRIYWK